MKVSTVINSIQALLLIPEASRASRIGPMTRALFDKLAVADPNSIWGAPDNSLVDETIPQINYAGLELVKHFESCSLEAYQDEVGVWTIGWGHTGLQHNDGTVYAGRKISQSKADSLLSYDMNQFESRVHHIVKVALTPDQFSALVSFDFNTGGLTLDNGSDSTLTKKLNSGDYSGANDEFHKWNKAGGNVLRGLTRRRASESNLFRSIHPCIVQG